MGIRNAFNDAKFNHLTLDLIQPVNKHLRLLDALTGYTSKNAR